MRRRDGDYRWLLDQGVPRYDEHGAFIGYLGSCVDITERVEANERIHRLSDMYAALSQVNDAIARAKNQQRLFERVCQITARFGSFATIWIAVFHLARRETGRPTRSSARYSRKPETRTSPDWLDVTDPRVLSA